MLPRYPEGAFGVDQSVFFLLVYAKGGEQTVFLMLWKGRQVGRLEADPSVGKPSLAPVYLVDRLID